MINVASLMAANSLPLASAHRIVGSVCKRLAGIKARSEIGRLVSEHGLNTQSGHPSTDG